MLCARFDVGIVFFYFQCVCVHVSLSNFERIGTYILSFNCWIMQIAGEIVSLSIIIVFFFNPCIEVNLLTERACLISIPCPLNCLMLLYTGIH